MIDVNTTISVLNTASAVSSRVADNSGVSGKLINSEKARISELTDRRNIAVGSEVLLEKLAQALDEFMPKELPNTRLQIIHDDGSGQFVYKAVDRDSGEVVRQYPSEDILKFISYYREQEGLLVDGSA